ncbi:carbohydrate kinase [Microbacterium sp. NPDC019599]|uniref:carbohydrate kinase family protein n=1 Tax=Microbacterium sp. NPDC019599 TaxID=3154690 RepID=UPI0033DC6228
MTGPEASPRLLVVGEALIDVVHRSDGAVDEAPGGSPANVALTLGRLGRAPQLLTRLGHDPHGETLRSWLAASDVDVVSAPAERTATATARLDESGAATYEFDLEWELAGTAAGPADWVHTGSVAALLQPGADGVVALLEESRATALVSYDPNIRPALLSTASVVRPQVEALVALADVVKASDEDLDWLYPGASVHEVAELWLGLGASLVVVTRGAGGALAVTGAGVVAVDAEPVAVVDTVGAGDTFMGALIDGLLDAGCSSAASRTALAGIPSTELAGILRRCALAAAITVSRPGADPPRRAELETSMARRSASAAPTKG